MRLADLARLHDKWIAQDTWYLIYRSAPEYSRDPSPETIDRFLDIMANPVQLGGLLRRLHELGVLEKIVPEFADARCLLQFNLYHKYTVDEQGYYHYCGRTDDMLKVSGNWVSPFEVESALLKHPHVLEAAVVGRADDSDLIKPQAYIVLNEGVEASDVLGQELKDFVKDQLAPYKYPRWIEFTDSLPKTATGKIQRFKLRS